MMKSIIYCSIILLSFLCVSCGNKTTGDEDNKDVVVSRPESEPLNISVYIDLSDRLIRTLEPPTQTQMERDTAIVNHLIDVFIEDCINNGKILNSKNHFQVFFYPAPSSSGIAQLAEGLNIDLSKEKAPQKRKKLKEMKEKFQTNLSTIYNDAISGAKWVGCDVWSFFTNKIVDKLCIREGYRNILVILTDGYLYAVNNKVKEGSAYSYILPQTLTDSNSSLITRRKGLSNLEVLMLEVNPYNPSQRDRLINVLEKWFKDMEVGDFVVSETALPVNTRAYIDSFMEE